MEDPDKYIHIEGRGVLKVTILYVYAGCPSQLLK